MGPNQRLAKEVLNGYLGNVARRVHLGVIEDSPISFADFAKEWYEGLRPDMKPRSKERFKGALDLHLKPYFKGALRAVTAPQVEVYVTQRAGAGAAASTINSEVNVLKMILRKAVVRKLLARNPLLDDQGRPLDGVRQLKAPPGRVRYLSQEEIGYIA